LPSFNLYPDVYVLPGQTWSVLYRPVNTALAATTGVAAFVKYTLYDGPDALIANKLLEMGVTVNPNNVDWYKRTLIEQQSAAASAAAVAATNGGA
jgi:spermidine/putrescine-binding protein